MVVGAVPVDLTAPTISGSAEKGQTLVEGHGTWTNEPTSYEYQWLRCNPAREECSAILGAVNQTYQAGQGDIGNTLVVQETADNESVRQPPEAIAATAVVKPIRL